MIDLTPEEVAACHEEAEREVGLQIAEFVEVQDGWYTERVVIDALPPAGPVPEDSTVEVTVVPHRVEKLVRPIPRMVTRPRWIDNPYD